GRLVLHPGERWEEACPPLGEPAPPSVSTHAHAVTESVAGAPPPIAVAPPPVAVAPPPVAVAPPPVAVAPPVSELSEQNDLYARGRAASHEGRTEEALAAYARLLALFPSGQLAESAS